MKKNCFIISHRPNDWISVINGIICECFEQNLTENLIELIKENSEIKFSVCMRRGAEMYAAKQILALKSYYPLVTLECILPYEEQTSDWSEDERDEYFGIIEKCDKETLFATRYTENCEELCIKHSSLICDILLCVN